MGLALEKTKEQAMFEARTVPRLTTHDTFIEREYKN